MTVTSTERSQAEGQNLAMLGYLLRLAIDEAEKIMGEEPHSFVRKAELGSR